MKKENKQTRLLSVSQAAKELSIRNETVKTLIYEGRIQVLEIGKRMKIPYSELERFISENLTTPKLKEGNASKIVLGKRNNYCTPKVVDASALLEKIIGENNGNSNKKR